MLFYNQKQEFIGIDEEGLKLLNYSTLEELLGVCTDVADLFAKEPGYIHNFKNFGWIDFLLHADSDATSAIVHAKGRTFSCTLSVQKLFMCEEPSANGYIIDMTHIKSLSGEEIKPHIITPQPPKESAPNITEKFIPKTEASPSIFPDHTDLTPTLLSEPDTLDVPAFNDKAYAPELDSIEDIYANLTLPLSHEELRAEEAYVPAVTKEVTPQVASGTHYTPAEQVYINNLKTDKGYRFDPKVAANELGLPVDLIEEFIGDFIQQAHEFKDELFEAALKGDTNNLRILSHKLKGVAANLRIEDAFEALSHINTSDEAIEIEANLKFFYSIIAKLEGKEVVETAAPVIPQNIDPTPVAPFKEEENDDDDIYRFALKQHVDEPVLKQEEKEEELVVLDEPMLEEELVVLNEPVAVEEPVEKLQYDSVAIAGALGIELPFFKELLDDYKHDAMDAAKRIDAAINAFDTHTWKRTAGELKGISDNLRLNEISDELGTLSQTNDAQEAHKASKRLTSFIAQI